MQRVFASAQNASLCFYKIAKSGILLNEMSKPRGDSSLSRSPLHQAAELARRPAWGPQLKSAAVHLNPKEANDEPDSTEEENLSGSDHGGMVEQKEHRAARRGLRILLSDCEINQSRFFPIKGGLLENEFNRPNNRICVACGLSRGNDGDGWFGLELPFRL